MPASRPPLDLSLWLAASSEPVFGLRSFGFGGSGGVHRGQHRYFERLAAPSSAWAATSARPAKPTMYRGRCCVRRVCVSLSSGQGAQDAAHRRRQGRVRVRPSVSLSPGHLALAAPSHSLEAEPARREIDFLTKILQSRLVGPGRTAAANRLIGACGSSSTRKGAPPASDRDRPRAPAARGSRRSARGCSRCRPAEAVYVDRRSALEMLWP
jgi:hypothetical protein